MNLACLVVVAVLVCCTVLCCADSGRVCGETTCIEEDIELMQDLRQGIEDETLEIDKSATRHSLPSKVGNGAELQEDAWVTLEKPPKGNHLLNNAKDALMDSWNMLNKQFEAVKVEPGRLNDHAKLSLSEKLKDMELAPSMYNELRNFCNTDGQTVTLDDENSMLFAGYLRKGNGKDLLARLENVMHGQNQALTTASRAHYTEDQVRKHMLDAEALQARIKGLTDKTIKAPWQGPPNEAGKRPQNKKGLPLYSIKTNEEMLDLLQMEVDKALRVVADFIGSAFDVAQQLANKRKATAIAKSAPSKSQMPQATAKVSNINGKVARTSSSSSVGSASSRKSSSSSSKSASSNSKVARKSSSSSFGSAPPSARLPVARKSSPPSSKSGSPIRQPKRKTR